jgi:hypothetical protein
MNFLKTNEASQIIWLDYCGYHLADNQMDLTPLQTLFLTKGRLKLYNDMNSTDESMSKSKYHN